MQKHDIVNQDQSVNLVPCEAGFKKIAHQAAYLMQGKDWHKLSGAERLLCKLLESQRFLSVNEPCNGFIGKAI